MRTDTSARRGQAAIEFAIGVFVFALVAIFLLDLAPVLVRVLDLQGEARADAGTQAFAAAEHAGGALDNWTGGAVNGLALPDVFKNESVQLPVLTSDGRLFEYGKARIEEHVAFPKLGAGPNSEVLR